MAIRTATFGSFVLVAAAANAHPAWSFSSDGFAIRSGADIMLKHRAEVVGGNLFAAGDLHMQHGSWTDGTAYYGTGLQATHAAGAGGGFVQSSAPFGGAPWSIPNIGSSNISVGHDGSWTVGAGAYKNLDAKHRSSVALSAGEYVFRSISLGHDAVLNVDTTLGDVFIFAEQDVTLNHRARINVAGDGGVFLVAGNRVSLGHDSVATAAVFSLAGRVDLEHRAELTGSIHAEGPVTLGHDSSLLYRAFGPSVQAVIPAPATAAVIAPGLLLLGRRRR